VITIFYFISVFVLIFVRIVIKLIYQSYTRKDFERINVIIYGAGDLGRIAKNTLTNGGPTNYVVSGFVDENPDKVGKSIEGIRVYSPEEFTDEMIQKHAVKEVVFSIQNIDINKRRAIMDKLFKLGIVIKSIPPVDAWIKGELKLKQIERINIEDLLQREPIQLNNPKIIDALSGKTVMVTGAAGSIGSEMVRQIITKKPFRLILVDQAETPVFNLKLELSEKHADLAGLLKFYIADVSDFSRMNHIFTEEKPDIIFHAAAYKHVPLMEENTYEAIRVNVYGTKNLADLAVKNKVETFVMISTDKAVKPTNVMGASKRFAEMYCQALGRINGKTTRFITTRFGNVLGSNGSVIKIFRNQIQKGGPVKVTHPEISRYFMTISESCQLVLEASTMGENAEIFLFEMGDPVKIVDLAQNMIKLAGYEPFKDIQIVYTGLRPGEKLIEELLCNSEDVMPTYHPQIKIGKISPVDKNIMDESIKQLEIALAQSDPFKMVSILKSAIPDYISNNSVFTSLDKVTV
jgi:FlaA1/EpsC-like NDP-sugar epimerase